MIKTIYEALRRFDELFTPGTTLFSDYVLWTSDWNGDFFRTCYISKAQPQRDRVLRENDVVIAALEKPLNLADILYHGDYSTQKETLLKLQICWGCLEPESWLEWNAEMGYGYRYVLNCTTGEIRKVEGTQPKGPC